MPLLVGPFALIWGVLLSITFLGWTAFIAALLSITRNRYTTYALALGVSPSPVTGNSPAK